jgi:hypothetical protein
LAGGNILLGAKLLSIAITLALLGSKVLPQHGTGQRKRYE